VAVIDRSDEFPEHLRARDGLGLLGFDPAVASSPFVASIVDVTGIVVYFTVARRLLGLA